MDDMVTSCRWPYRLVAQGSSLGVLLGFQSWQVALAGELTECLQLSCDGFNKSTAIRHLPNPFDT